MVEIVESLPTSVYISHMGTDLDVVNDAKVSFAKRSEWKVTPINPRGVGELEDRDKKLIEYLARGVPRKEWEEYIDNIVTSPHWDYVESIVDYLVHIATHWVPFSHTAIKLRMKAPVPIRTQCFKHKVGFVESEESRRYIKSVPELYVPPAFHSIPDNIKQGAGDVHEQSEWWKSQYRNLAKECILLYEEMIEDGVAPEEARFILPQGVMVHWIWTGNLASYARYYNQRSDNHAQGASQDLANVVAGIIEPLFPVSWAALTRKKEK